MWPFAENSTGIPQAPLLLPTLSPTDAWVLLNLGLALSCGRFCPPADSLGSPLLPTPAFPPFLAHSLCPLPQGPSPAPRRTRDAEGPAAREAGCKLNILGRT